MQATLISITFQVAKDKPEKTYPARLVHVPDSDGVRGYVAMVSVHELYKDITTYDEEFINDACERLDSSIAGYMDAYELTNLTDDEVINVLDLA